METGHTKPPNQSAVSSTEESDPRSHNRRESCTLTPYLRLVKKPGPQNAGSHLAFDSFSCAEEKQGEIKVEMPLPALH